MNAPPGDITLLLERWKSGDHNAESELATRIYPILHNLAAAQVRRHGGLLTLRATELANEAYSSLARQQSVDWQNRDHFYAIAATVIRRVVVDYLRARTSEKRGSGVLFVSIEDLGPEDTPFQEDAVDWIEVDRAINELAAADPRCARVVELKIFSGLTVEQIARVCDSSTATVTRQWRFARTWLAHRLENGENRVA